MTTNLTLKGCWNGAGYRDLGLECTDDAGRKYMLRISASEMQRLVNACADAVKQIGAEGPIDWDRHPHQIYWPEVTPWRTGSRFAKATGSQL